MKEFYREVLKAYAEHSSPNERIRAHGPSTYRGTHEKHSQFMFISGEGKTTKFRMNE
ncbi:MAG: hypothetical protein K0B11_16845 [Mariniphaga sp.]|nr:hypothetical protein [Mariniphaga sp.]